MKSKRSSKLIVRKAKLADLDQIVALENRSFDFDLFTRAQYRYLITKANAIALVLERRGGIIGSAVALVRRDSPGAHLYTIAISPELQGRGYGALLLAAIESAAKKLNRERLTLEVRIDNHLALRLYRKRGYEIHGRIEAYYEDGCDALRMVKTLAARPKTLTR